MSGAGKLGQTIALSARICYREQAEQVRAGSDGRQRARDSDRRPAISRRGGAGDRAVQGKRSIADDTGQSRLAGAALANRRGSAPAQSINR